MNRKPITFFAIGAAAVVWAVASRVGTPERERRVPVAVAERRSLEATLVESGTLQAARWVTLASEIRSNRAKIVSLREDGTFVQIDDEIVRFDPTPFEEERAKLVAELRDHEAAALRADQERKLAIAKAEESLEAAKHRKKLASLTLESFEKGSGALTVREAEVRSAGADAELARAKRDLVDLNDMVSRGFVSDGELERRRMDVEELERQRALERDRLDTAKGIVFPRDVEKAKSEVAEARDAVVRAEAVLYHSHEFFRAAIESADRKVESAQVLVRRAEEELEKTVIRSPLAGFLMLQEIPLDTGRRRPQVGDSVWSGQAIAAVPDLSQMVVLTRVREIDLHRVRSGMLGRVSVEAYPDLALGGRVDHVGSLAEAAPDSAWKFFSLRLRLDGTTDERLRPGMSTRVEFLIDTAKDAVVAPIESVFSLAGRDVCYVRRDGEVWEQPVALGIRSETHVQVTNGVEAGEELMLAPPAGKLRRPPAPAADA